MTDIALRYPKLPEGARQGQWPSVASVTALPLAPLSFNHQDSLKYYRDAQHSYVVLWVETEEVAVYRLFGDLPGPFLPDYRLTERGEFELVGLSKVPDQPPPGDGPEEGGPPVPVSPYPLSPAHPSMSG